MTNNLVHPLIKINARICRNHMHANLRSNSNNASSCYVNLQRTLLYVQIVGFVLELALSLMQYMMKQLKQHETISFPFCFSF